MQRKTCWQAWDEACCSARRSLNTVLTAHNLPPNALRDKGVYKTNWRFWTTRPLTEDMIALASGDVHSLFKLREEQCVGFGVWGKAGAGAEASEANLKKYREVRHHVAVRSLLPWWHALPVRIWPRQGQNLALTVLCVPYSLDSGILIKPFLPAKHTAHMLYRK